MKTNQKTVIHYSLCFQEFTVSIKLPEQKSSQETNFKSIKKCSKQKQYVKPRQQILYHFSSWNQDCSRRKTKQRSRSLRVVVSSISSRGLSVVRPWEEPLRSNRLWIRYSEQNTLPITINRVCFSQHNLQVFIWLYFVTSIHTVQIRKVDTNLLTSNRFDTVNPQKFCYERILVLTHMLIVTGKHPDEHLTWPATNYWMVNSHRAESETWPY